MKFISTTFLAGVASVAFAGAVAAHTLTLQLPDGTTEHIDYAGDVAPHVSFAPAQAAPVAEGAFGPQSPFALMQQIAAQMDRDADAMMRHMQKIAAQPVAGPGQPEGRQPVQVDLANLPPGTQSYSFVSTLSPSGVCSQSTEIIAKGPGQKSQVIRHNSGNCCPATLGGPSISSRATACRRCSRRSRMPAMIRRASARQSRSTIPITAACSGRRAGSRRCERERE